MYSIYVFPLKLLNSGSLAELYQVLSWVMTETGPSVLPRGYSRYVKNQIVNLPFYYSMFVKLYRNVFNFV